MISIVHARRARRRLPRVEQPAPARAREQRAREQKERIVFAVVGALLLGTSVSGMRSLAAAPLGALLGWRISAARKDRAHAREQREVRRAMPEALDRLTTCVLAGMSIERALRTVTPRTHGTLGRAFGVGLRALEAGMPRAEAYARIGARASSDEVSTMLGMLARAERYGAPVSVTLVAYAQEMRSRARAAAEAEARVAPVKLVFPLVFCFLPAFVLLTVAPIAISAVRALGGI